MHLCFLKKEKKSRSDGQMACFLFMNIEQGDRMAVRMIFHTLLPSLNIAATNHVPQTTFSVFSHFSVFFSLFSFFLSWFCLFNFPPHLIYPISPNIWPRHCFLFVPTVSSRLFLLSLIYTMTYFSCFTSSLLFSIPLCSDPLWSHQKPVLTTSLLCPPCFAFLLIFSHQQGFWSFARNSGGGGQQADSEEGGWCCQHHLHLWGQESARVQQEPNHHCCHWWVY